MSFLAPWALAIGALAAIGTVLLHLVARQRPAAYALPTARFIPDRRTLVSRVAARPRDLLLLALRVLLILAAAAAFARPVLSPARAPRARILLLDRSAAVASDREALARARRAIGDGVATRIIAFDSAARLIGVAGTALDSLDGVRDRRPSAVGSISASLAAARRLGAALGGGADSVELVLVSPVAAGELDPSVDSLRAQWPGAMSIARIASRTDSGAAPALEREMPADDLLGPALAAVPVAPSPSAVRLRRAAPDAADSAFARVGGTLVRWDTAGGAAPGPAAVAMGDDVVVATLGRRALAPGGRVLARWADGAPAAAEWRLGDGCVREIGMDVPAAGDLPLRPAFQRIVRGLVARCGTTSAGVAADSAALARLTGGGGTAAGWALSDRGERPTPIVPWLLALALACALAELFVRARGEPEAA
jgi:hypothetical protein